MTDTQAELDYLIKERIGMVTDDETALPSTEVLAMIWLDCLREVGC